MDQEKINRIIKMWGFATTCLGIFLTLIGIHNIDTAFNMKEKEIDLGVFMNERSRAKIYLDGILMNILGLMSMLIGNLILLEKEKETKFYSYTERYKN